MKFGQIVKGDASGRLGIAEPEYVAKVHAPVINARDKTGERAFGTA